MTIIINCIFSWCISENSVARDEDLTHVRFRLPFKF